MHFKWNILCLKYVLCLRHHLHRRKKQEIHWVDDYYFSLNNIFFFFFYIEFLQPYKTRPQTTSLTANRRICAALGLKNPMSSDKTKTERQKIESARRKKKKT